MRYAVIILLLLAMPLVASYGEYSIDFYQEGKKVLVSENMIFDTVQNVTILLQTDAHQVLTNNQYTLSGRYLDIWGKEIRVNHSTENPIDTTADNYYFSYKVSPPENARTITIRLILNEGFGTSKEDIFPKNFNLETDGKRIVIVWNFNSTMLEESTIPIFVKFSDQRDLPTGAKYSIAIVVLVVLIISSMIILRHKKALQRRNGNKRNNKKKDDYTHYLAQSEKEVIQALRNNQNEMWQKDIQRATNFSKAKLSRVIRNLEAKNLVSRTPIGNTNKVRLKKK